MLWCRKVQVQSNDARQTNIFSLFLDDDTGVASPVLQIVDGPIPPQIIPETTASMSAFNKIKKGKLICSMTDLHLCMKWPFIYSARML